MIRESPLDDMRGHPLNPGGRFIGRPHATLIQVKAVPVVLATFDDVAELFGQIEFGLCGIGHSGDFAYQVK